jgi:hypothetical protein
LVRAYYCKDWFLNENYMRYIGRRAFLKKSLLTGIASFFGIGMNFGYSKKSKKGEKNYPNQVKRSVCSVKKEIYVRSPQDLVASIVSMTYIGQGLRKEEFRAFQRSSDWSDNEKKRWSEDNGLTWSEWVPVPKKKNVAGELTQSGGANQEGSGPHDPVSGRLIKPVFQRIVKGDPVVALSELWKGNRLFCDHGFYQLSADDGKTWGEAHQLKYEEGPDFDPQNWGDDTFFRSNEMYIGRVITTKKGTVIISSSVPVLYKDEDDEKYPSVFPNTYREGCVAGAMCFVGKWNSSQEDYDWKKSSPVFLPRKISSRGLVELDLSELKNGNLLLIMRGSNTKLDVEKSPARKWFSVSRDGGLNWDNVKEMRYDTGEQFYSPASISRTIRSTKTGKLYWIGNITEVPAVGNSPRYPLQIIEIDEDGPSFIKDTLTVIDDRDPEKDSEHLQLSNFTLLEDRVNHNIEIYLTRLGENGGGKDIWTANAYKYTLIL